MQIIYLQTKLFKNALSQHITWWFMALFHGITDRLDYNISCGFKYFFIKIIFNGWQSRLDTWMNRCENDEFYEKCVIKRRWVVASPTD